MRAFIGEEWIDGKERIEVRNPYDGTVADTVPRADESDVMNALKTAVSGAERMAAVSGYDRYLMLRRASDLLAARVEAFARTITLEEGKTISEARAEATRAVETLALSAEEAKRLHGETIPLEGAPGGAGKLGFTVRVPCGVVVAITPFNFPLNLVCHKVGPALAAGNAVIVKPASDTPLSALKLTEILLEAGVPPSAIQCITGSGGMVGGLLCSDPRVRKITFTGSRDVGEAICRTAGIKKVTMELGSNAPVIVLRDANPDKVAACLAATGYSNAGQVCISAQRVLVASPIYEDVIGALKPEVEGIATGNPLDETVRMGPMVRQEDATRVNSWIGDAVSAGARIITGGEVAGTMHAPTVLADVDAAMRISSDELFGPAVALSRFQSIDEAIALANETRYGLSAGVFTENLTWALRFVRELHTGNIMINWGPQFRADLMPYGGLKESGFGKEGPAYAVQEMTELKTVVLH